MNNFHNHMENVLTVKVEVGDILQDVMNFRNRSCTCSPPGKFNPCRASAVPARRAPFNALINFAPLRLVVFCVHQFATPPVLHPTARIALQGASQCSVTLHIAP